MYKLQATNVKLPQKWFNYAVQRCPKRVPTLSGDWISIDRQLVEAEAQAQYGLKPVDCRPSKYQTDGPDTTWIISFAQPITKASRLFDASEPARLINKKSPPTQCKKCWEFHDEHRCQRRSLCKSCAQPAHEGSCNEPERCVLCRGPHTATDLACPVRPVRRDGVYVRLTKSQRSAAKQAGERAYRTQQKQATPAADNASTIVVGGNTVDKDSSIGLSQSSSNTAHSSSESDNESEL